MPAVKKPSERKPVKGKPVVATGSRGGRKLLIKRQPTKEDGDIDLDGRPTKYRPEMDDQAFKLALLGYSQAEMARFFNVGQTTFARWLDSFPSFRSRLREGQEPADAEVAHSLYQQARGYDVVVEELKVVNVGNFQQEVRKERVRRFVEADYRATALWMKARNQRVEGDFQRGQGGARISWDETPKDFGGSGSPAEVARAAREAIAAADAETTEGEME